MNKLIKPAKIALAKKYGYKNVSVKNGQGTAWGWVEVSIETYQPMPCTQFCKGWEHTYTCQDARRSVTNEAREIMYKAWQEAGLKPYTYSSDDGYGTERDCTLIDVNYLQ